MCELDHRRRPPYCLMEAVSVQTDITVSCIQHIIQVYLKKNTIRKLLLDYITFFQSLNVIDKIIFVFIHSWLVSMVTDESESHMLHHNIYMLHHNIWLLWSFLQPRILTIFLISTVQIC